MPMCWPRSPGAAAPAADPGPARAPVRPRGTWARQAERQDKGPTFHRVLFTGPKVGWVSTEILGTILHTADGGATWEKVPLPSQRAAGVSYTEVAAVGNEFVLQYSKFVFRTA